jgi:hypothetical protein
MTKNKAQQRKELLASDSQLEEYARIFYIDRFSNLSNEQLWESKIKWGLPMEQR